MKLCRFKTADSGDAIRLGLLESNGRILDLSSAGLESMTSLLETEDVLKTLGEKSGPHLPSHPLAAVQLVCPVERQEVWAAGVTYLRSKKARMDESNFSATAYDQVYDAPRPELFFKSLPEKVAGPGEPVGIRRDAAWNVPEPELALVLNSRGQIVGYTVGNDMSSRDIEGENLLYLPQAKIYERSCAVGPVFTIGAAESEAREWTIRLEIVRQGTAVFSGETSVRQIKRSFEELAGYLFRSQTFPLGAILLTGTGVVPGDDFTLQPEDRIRIDISGIGRLENPVISV